MKIILWRIVLSLGMLATGFAVGANVGARFFVTRADGLAGGVMVLWYGVLGAIFLLVISIILGLKLKGKALSVTALVFTLLSVVYYGMAAFKARESFQAEAGSASEYNAIPGFTATMYRLDLSDPFLFVKMEVDSRKRKWIQTGPAPKNQVFTSTIRAKTLVEMRAALEEMALLGQEAFADCRNTPGPFTKGLSWNLELERNVEYENGIVSVNKINLSETCLREHPVINRALMLVEQASRSPMSDVKRK